jgi:AcrR family transcriptional regulator
MARADRRKQLLQIARQLVAKEGTGALTMMALSERAHVAKPVVYSHFANRTEVAIALLDEHYEAIGRFVRERLAGASTVEEYFSRLVDASFEFEGASDTPVRKITNGFSAGDRVNQAFLRHEEEGREHWEQLLELFGVRREAIEVAAYALASTMTNTVYTFAIMPQQKVARETLKAMLSAAMHALAPDSKRKLQGVPGFAGRFAETKYAAAKNPASGRRPRSAEKSRGATNRPAKRRKSAATTPRQSQYRLDRPRRSGR